MFVHQIIKWTSREVPGSAESTPLLTWRKIRLGVVLQDLKIFLSWFQAERSNYKLPCSITGSKKTVSVCSQTVIGRYLPTHSNVWFAGCRLNLTNNQQLLAHVWDQAKVVTFQELCWNRNSKKVSRAGTGGSEGQLEVFKFDYSTMEDKSTIRITACGVLTHLAIKSNSASEAETKYLQSVCKTTFMWAPCLLVSTHVLLFGDGPSGNHNLCLLNCFLTGGISFFFFSFF